VGFGPEDACRAGRMVEEKQLELLIEDAYPRILRAALALTGNRSEAEDLAQETFLQAIGAMKRFDGKSTTNTWLYSILLNLHRKLLRTKDRRWRRWLKWFEGASRRRMQEQPGLRLEDVEWKESLWKSVKRLPSAQQEAVVLRYSEGLTYDQIAETQSCPVGTAKSRVHHGILALRAMLDADDDVCSEEGACEATRMR
jgi:RNA polymerase sigma-70 factor, ECF subfamily